jgi:hypothetical protein
VLFLLYDVEKSSVNAGMLEKVSPTSTSVFLLAFKFQLPAAPLFSGFTIPFFYSSSLTKTTI